MQMVYFRNILGYMSKSVDYRLTFLLRSNHSYHSPIVTVLLEELLLGPILLIYIQEESQRHQSLKGLWPEMETFIF